MNTPYTPTDPCLSNNNVLTPITVTCVCFNATIATAMVGGASIIILGALIPRQLQGIRSVPAVTWELYSCLAFFGPILTSCGCVWIYYRSLLKRLIATVVATAVWMFLYYTVVQEILARDFQGKF